MTSKDPNILTETYPIRFYDVDARGMLSIVSLCNFLQDAAGKHAHELGVAVQNMLDENGIWALSRLSVQMDSYPGWRDQIQVHTWPSGMHKLFAYRDFSLTDRNNNTFGSAVAAWLVIDTVTRRPVRIKPIFDKFNLAIPDREGMNNLDKLPGLDKHEHEKRFSVRHSDIDVNKHVNTVSYVEWVLESIPHEVHDTGTLMELEINFLAETFFGERIISRCLPLSKDHPIFHHSIVREGDFHELVRAKTVWKKLT